MKTKIGFAIVVGFILVGCALNKGNDNSKTPVSSQDNTTEMGESNQDQRVTSKHDLEMYPKPKKGFQRYIIELDKQEHENEYKVEIIASKEMEVDCNNYSLNGAFSEKIVQGWGYSYYEFSGDGSAISTLMGCPDGQLQMKDVESIPCLVRYNSNLPIVVYVPEELEVRYSLWKKENKRNKARRK